MWVHVNQREVIESCLEFHGGAMAMYGQQVKEHSGMRRSLIAQEARLVQSPFPHLLTASAPQCVHKGTWIGWNPWNPFNTLEPRRLLCRMFGVSVNTYTTWNDSVVDKNPGKSLDLTELFHKYFHFLSFLVTSKPQSFRKKHWKGRSGTETTRENSFWLREQQEIQLLFWKSLVQWLISADANNL